MENTKQELVIRDCGTEPYLQMLTLQEQLCLERQADKIPNTVLLVEHPATITLGARKTENKLLFDDTFLRDKGIEPVQVRRGGGTTGHNPGQMVFYPIIKLKSLKMGVNEYVHTLEQIGIELLESVGVPSQRRKGFPGLWVGQDKIASIGVQIKKWVTFHGMAININNDLEIFSYMVPCGLDGVRMTSVKEILKHEVPMDKIKMELSRILNCKF